MRALLDLQSVSLREALYGFRAVSTSRAHKKTGDVALGVIPSLKQDCCEKNQTVLTRCLGARYPYFSVPEGQCQPEAGSHLLPFLGRPIICKPTLFNF